MMTVTALHPGRRSTEKASPMNDLARSALDAVCPSPTAVVISSAAARSRACSATGTSSPAGANMIAPSNFSGGTSDASPTESTPSSRVSAWLCSPRVKCALPPKP